MTALSVSAWRGRTELVVEVDGKGGKRGAERMRFQSCTTFLVCAESLRPCSSLMWETKQGTHPSPAHRGCLKSSESIHLWVCVMSVKYKKKEQEAGRVIKIISCVGRQCPLHEGALYSACSGVGSLHSRRAKSLASDVVGKKVSASHENP